MRSLRTRSGFTLLELSVVLAIIAVVMASGMTVFSSALQKKQWDETKAKQQAIQATLYHYRIATNRIPCPADATLAPTATNFGIEAATPGTCTGGTPAANFAAGGNVEGMVPTKTLRLPDDYAFDGWGRRIMYAVDKRFTAANGFTTNNISTGGSLTVAPISVGTTPSFADAGFETPNIGANNSNPVTAWTYDNAQNSSIIGNGAVINGGFQGAPEGTQAAFLWHDATLTQTVTFSQGGSYSISFMAAQRICCQDETEELQVTVDGSIVYDAIPPGTTFILYNTNTFTVTAGAHTISFISISNGKANSVFIDAVSIGTVSSWPPAVYSLISFGPNGHGAYPRSGGSTRFNAGSVNTDELNNCDCDSAAAATAFDGKFVQAPARLNPANALDSFDDLVVYAMRSQLASPAE